jgi:cellulose synthase/poly-beta-1,6-N-acetylglucosamine synthase-like glycosyltransferase
MGALVKQRTRWNQGFLQVLKKGVWRELPTRRQRFLARFTLAQPFLQAFAGICVPASIAFALFAKVSLVVALTTFIPAIPTIAMICFEIAGLREFCRVYYVRARASDYLTLIIGTPVYMLLLGLAAIRAVAREMAGDNSWEKTAHSGAHLSNQAVQV